MMFCTSLTYSINVAETFFFPFVLSGNRNEMEELTLKRFEMQSPLKPGVR